MRKNLFAVLMWFLAAAIANAPRAANFSVSPLRLDLSATAPVAVVEIGNTGTEPVTVQAQSRSWSQATGQDEYGEARAFIISPAIFTIPAGGRQVVRVALRGAAPRDIEAAYRLVMTEIPGAQPSAPPATPGLRVALRMDIPVYVSPQQAGAQANAGFSVDAHGRTPRIAVSNAGNAHFRMVDVVVREGARTLAELPVLVVLPGATRTIELPGAPASGPREFRVTADSNSGPIDVSLRHAP